MTKKPPPAVQFYPLDDLVPYARNSRKHSEQQVQQIAAAIQEFGWTMPVLCEPDGGIIAGHGRVMAAEVIYRGGGLIRLADGTVIPDGAVPVLVARDWPKEKVRAYVIADNKLALNAEWDEELLRLEIADLGADDFDLGLLGFSEDELSKFIDFAGPAGGEVDPDSIPDVPTEAVSKAGDVWVLGKHRLICGSCTDPATVSALLRGAIPHLMVTDPPYGVEYDPSWRAKAGVNKNKGKMGNVLNDDRADWREAWALFPGDVAYVWHADRFTREVLNSLEDSHFRPRCMIIWVKDRFTLGRGDYHWQHEPCWYVVREGKPGRFVGGRGQSTTWEIPAREDAGVGHGTQKPIECMKRPIENNSEPGDSVYEPFSGSGTTIIAGEITARAVFAVELNPAYVDVAVERWQKFTGRTATLESSGRSFSEVARERAVAASV